jgi:transcriptional regulator with XRE-family HTH domain
MRYVITLGKVLISLIFRRLETKAIVVYRTGSLFVSSLSSRNFSKNLQRILEEKGWTQKMLSEKVGVTQGNISLWISCRRSPSLETLDILSRVLNVTVSELLKDDSETPATTAPTLEDVAQTVLRSLGFESPRKLKKKDAKKH